jgi:hypothetical protein
MRSVGHVIEMTKDDPHHRAAAPAPPGSSGMSLASTQGDSPAELLAETCFMLAQALWEAPPDRGRDRTRAMTLAEQARDAFLEVGVGRAKDVAEIEQWIREHAVG